MERENYYSRLAEQERKLEEKDDKAATKEKPKKAYDLFAESSDSEAEDE